MSTWRVCLLLPPDISAAIGRIHPGTVSKCCAGSPLSNDVKKYWIVTRKIPLKLLQSRPLGRIDVSDGHAIFASLKYTNEFLLVFTVADPLPLMNGHISPSCHPFGHENRLKRAQVEANSWISLRGAGEKEKDFSLCHQRDGSSSHLNRTIVWQLSSVVAAFNSFENFFWKKKIETAEPEEKAVKKSVAS